jgi:hypothetical protein
MLLQFCAGLALLCAFGVALQMRTAPFPRAVKALSVLALLAAFAAVVVLATRNAPLAVWLLLAGWLGLQTGAHRARRAWLRGLRQNPRK